VESWELFDLKADPRELKNIYDTEEGRRLAPSLKKQLLGLIEKYDDSEAKAIFNMPVK
jgi:hypothetical protein